MLMSDESAGGRWAVPMAAEPPEGLSTPEPEATKNKK